MGIGRAPVSGGEVVVVGWEGVSEVRSMGVEMVLLVGGTVVVVLVGKTLMKETSGASMGYCGPKMKERRY
jgi:hypothetical protein